MFYRFHNYRSFWISIKLQRYSVTLHFGMFDRWAFDFSCGVKLLGNKSEDDYYDYYGEDI